MRVGRLFYNFAPEYSSRVSKACAVVDLRSPRHCRASTRPSTREALPSWPWLHPASRVEAARCCSRQSGSSGAAAHEGSGQPSSVPDVSDRQCVTPAGVKRYAIVGGGFAGVATAHFLASAAASDCPVVIHLYDVAGLVSSPGYCHTCILSTHLQHAAEQVSHTG